MVAALLIVLSTLAACGPEQHNLPKDIDRQALLAHWRDYQGQEVIVSGLVVFGEGAIMYLPRRPELPIRDGPDQTEAMFVIPSISMEQNPGKLELDYLKYPGDGVVARLRGRFVGAATRTFGHQNCCRFRLEVSQVLSLRTASAADR